MSFKIDFLGLIYFYRKGNGRLLLLPDGTGGGVDDNGGVIPPHYASFFLEKVKVIDDRNWRPLATIDQYGVNVNEYSISYSSKLTISGVDTASARGCLSFGAGGGIGSSHDSKVLHLKDYSDMNIDPEKANTIAQMSIQQGTLEAFLFKDAIVSRLTVTNSPGPITITATSDRGTKEIVVLDETEIVLSNTSDIAGTHGQGPQLKLKEEGEDDHHFQLYSQLAGDGKPHKLTEPTSTPNLAHFPSSQAYIIFLVKGQNVPGVSCSNTCC